MATSLDAQTATADVSVVDGYIPIVDIGSALTGDAAARAVVAEVIGRAGETSGFFVVTGHGVDEDLVRRMEAVSLAFFDLPTAVKERYATDPGDPTIRGWYGTPSFVSGSEDLETPPDLCELFTVNRLGEPGVATEVALGEDFAVWSRPNQWPDEIAEFRSTWMEYYGELETLAAEIMRFFGLALDLGESFFEDKIDDHVTNLVVNHYPPVAGEPIEGQWRKGPHSDWGTLTVLYQDGTGGLEVYEREHDRWTSVPVVPGSFVVNVGDLMQLWTNDRWRSAKHRVPVPPAEIRSTPRISIPFFHQPNWSVEVACLASCLEPGESPHHRPVTSGGYLLEKIRTAYD
ncbi:MAG: 2OG-Fe(II) oxygenase family protein [Actinomycetota bacterium]